MSAEFDVLSAPHVTVQYHFSVDMWTGKIRLFTLPFKTYILTVTRNWFLSDVNMQVNRAWKRISWKQNNWNVLNIRRYMVSNFVSDAWKLLRFYEMSYWMYIYRSDEGLSVFFFPFEIRCGKFNRYLRIDGISTYINFWPNDVWVYLSVKTINFKYCKWITYQKHVFCTIKRVEN